MTTRQGPGAPTAPGPSHRTALTVVRDQLADRRAKKEAAVLAAARGQLELPGLTEAGPQLRRRREASRRLPPLQDGRRDTLARRRAPLVGRHLVVEVGKRTAWLLDEDSNGRGRGDRVFALLDSVQLEQRQWDSTRRCWMVPVDRADDVLAHAEYRERWTVETRAVDR